MNSYIPPMRFVPAMRPSGALSKAPVLAQKGSGVDDRLLPSRTSPMEGGFFSGAPIVITGMPPGGSTFIDGNRTDDARSHWATPAEVAAVANDGIWPQRFGGNPYTDWYVPTVTGVHEVVVVAPNGERRVASVNVRGTGSVIRWAGMKALAPVNTALGGYGASSGLYAPSGALTSAQILDLQGALVWLGRMPASGITGRMPVASPAVLRDFQDNYNRDPAVRSRGYSPRPPIGVDGLWGPTTQAALQNFVPGARAAAAARGIPQVPVDIPVEADGWHSAPGPGAQASITPIGKPGVTTMVKGGTPAAATPATAVRPSTASPAVIPPSTTPPASTFPLVPVLAIGGGVAAIGLALYVRSRRNKKGR